MSNKIPTLKRQKRHNNSTPEELVARVNQIKKHRTIWEQRNTFSLPQLHGKHRCRWHSHYMKLPYFHIVDIQGASTIVHILLFRHRQILTLAKTSGNWNVTGLTPEDNVANIVQSQHLHTGHLHKVASRSKMSQAARVLGIKASKLPKLTNANADVIINSESIHKDLHQIRDLAQRKEVELSK